MIDILNITSEIALRYMPKDVVYDKETLIQVMAWCNKSLPEPMLTKIYNDILCHHTTMS